MKTTIKRLALSCMLAAGLAGVASAEMTVEQLERELMRLKQQVDTSGAEQDRLRVSGYVSAGLAHTDAPVFYDGGLGAADVIVNTDSAPQTKGGVQFDYQIDNRTSATVQLVAEGQTDFNVTMEYGFIKWAVDEDHFLRFGRLRAPLYKYSDVLNVAYSQPWGVAPSEIYGISPINTIDGFDYLSYFETGPVNHSLNVYGSSSDYFRNIRGIALTSEWNGFNARAHYFGGDWSIENYYLEIAQGLAFGAEALCQAANRSQDFSYPEVILDLTPGLPTVNFSNANGCGDPVALPDYDPVFEAVDPIAEQYQRYILQLTALNNNEPVEDVRVEFISAALEYNHQYFYVISEWAATKITKALPDYESYYVTVGLNLPFNLSPYYTVGKIETVDDDQREAYHGNPDFYPGSGLPTFDPVAFPTGIGEDLSFIARTFNTHQRSNRLGIRWDATANIAVFLDAERFHDFRGTHGLFDTEVTELPSARKLNDDDEHYVYRFTVAARF